MPPIRWQPDRTPKLPPWPLPPLAVAIGRGLRCRCPACGKSHLHKLEPEDLVALTIEAAAMAGVKLAGTEWIPGQGAL